jgi:hypothetical protein
MPDADHSEPLATPAIPPAPERGALPARPFPLVLLEWRPVIRSSLRGFAKFRLGRTLVINDCPAHCSHGRKWVALPAKPQLSRERELVRDANGKLQYSAVLEWTDRTASDAFSDAAVGAIEFLYPHAFDAEAAA